MFNRVKKTSKTFYICIQAYSINDKLCPDIFSYLFRAFKHVLFDLIESILVDVSLPLMVTQVKNPPQLVLKIGVFFYCCTHVDWVFYGAHHRSAEKSFKITLR